MTMWSLIAFSAALMGTPSTPVQPAAFQPTSAVTVRARVSVRIAHAARFGQDHSQGQQGAQRSEARLSDASGELRPAHLLEFE